MMVLVRRMKKYNPDGLLVGIFHAHDRIELFSVIDEFTDPYGCEYYIFPYCSGFMVNDVTSDQFLEWFKFEQEDESPPDMQIESWSELLFDKDMFIDDNRWHPVVCDGEDMESWWIGSKHPECDDELNVIIGMESWDEEPRSQS